ncbi:enoyl-CoA hydratase/isomerase family protein [Nocardioides immobilis]|uniref:Enoyl-CoA hydratase/isomerase family protein n=1 Tax=Nocardioides immobilis TaxID=2049295 RepID=A0A417Y0T1_9ACTN|nr:enoyl-CoA hydratase/isomerase family protein [Nocardioides immobilis]RHW26258.1 enoyl-CoA hydratase/isomerase family protein [Nocardioides immobilis]
MDYRTLRIDAAGNGRVTLTFTRADLMNRMDDESRAELITALVEVGRDSQTRSIVLAAEGQVFSAGGDFDMMRRKHGDRAAVQRGTEDARRLVETLNDVRVPLVAAMHGHAFGVGSTVVLSCDIVVASRGALLADSHVKVGLVAGDGGVVVWPANMGLVKAKRHLLTGDPLPAEEAHRLGVISDLVDTPDEVLPAAERIADSIAALPPLAVQGTKKSFNVAQRIRIAEVLELSGQYELETLHSDDLIEAIDAFQQKRVGVYEGR